MAKFNSPVTKVPLSETASGEVVAAVPGKRICVLRVMVLSDAAITVTFASGTDDLTGAIPLDARNGWRDGMPRNADDPDDCLFETAPGAALNVELSGAGNLGGYLAYFTR
jgi:hypothetical protein